MKKVKKVAKQKLIELMFKGKIKDLVTKYRLSCIAECFNCINERYYNEFGVNVNVEVLDFLDRCKNYLVSKNALEEEKENDSEKA